MRLLTLGAVAVALSACVSSQEIPLQQNVWRIDTDASGLIGVSAAGNSTLKRAATLTLEQGYERFVLTDTSSSRGSVYAGRTPTFVTGQATSVGNYTYGTATAYGGAPMYAPTANIGATVVMLNRGDPGFDKALDARAIVKRFGG